MRYRYEPWIPHRTQPDVDTWPHAAPCSATHYSSAGAKPDLLARRSTICTLLVPLRQTFSWSDVTWLFSKSCFLKLRKIFLCWFWTDRQPRRNYVFFARRRRKVRELFARDGYFLPEFLWWIFMECLKFSGYFGYRRSDVIFHPGVNKKRPDILLGKILHQWFPRVTVTSPNKKFPRFFLEMIFSKNIFESDGIYAQKFLRLKNDVMIMNNVSRQNKIFGQSDFSLQKFDQSENCGHEIPCLQKYFLDDQNTVGDVITTDHHNITK